MTSREYINRFKKNLPLLFILIIAAVLRFYKINLAFPFDFDQQVPAYAAYDFFINHKISLIGQELSFQGFYLGPLHNLIQFIPYGICSLLPDCVPYFYLVISLVVAISLYFTIKKIIDSKTAIIACAIYALSFAQISSERGVDSNYFIFLSSILVLYCLYKYLFGKRIFLTIAAFISGIAVVNFNPVFIFSTLTLCIFALTKKDKKIVDFATAGAAFGVNFLPLFIFNFRHNNLLTNSLVNFLNQNVSAQVGSSKSFFLIAKVLLPFYSNYFFQNASPVFMLTTLLLLFYGLFCLKKSQNKFLIVLPLWIALTIFGFIFYSGHIPDYYFDQTILPAIIIISFALGRNSPLFLVFALVFIFANLSAAVKYKTPINYNIKKESVQFVIGDSLGKSFKVYYQMPPGFNTGYEYLFKALGHLPQANGQNLYILDFSDPSRFDSRKYIESFPKNQIGIKIIGFVHILSVK